MKNQILDTVIKAGKDAARELLRPPVINYFGTSREKNALVSFISVPFRKGISISHTNYFEAMEIAKVLNQLGYNVDAADYFYEGKIDYSRYDFIIGFGEPLINSFYNRTREITTVYYGTGMHVCTQNHNTLNRIKEVYSKKGVWLPESGRIVDKAWSIQTTLVDAMILLGNDEVTKTYSPYFKGKIINIPASFYTVADYKEIIAAKDFNKARKNFLWFGSSGLIHKGLDLLLDIFYSRNDIDLHICGPINNEPGFAKAYHKELTAKANIHNYGFVSLDSGLFKELLKTCAFVIFPSCSEGGGAAILSVCGNGGLIPLLSKEASVDTENFGFLFEEINTESISKVINSVITLDEIELKEKSNQAGKVISEKHNQDNYSLELKKAITEVIK
jgi:glycosyltransferase involved in cell wall biosynthesis